jgi:hypothetical protein
MKLKILNYAFIKEIVIYDGAYEFSMFAHALFFSPSLCFAFI